MRLGLSRVFFVMVSLIFYNIEKEKLDQYADTYIIFQTSLQFLSFFTLIPIRDDLHFKHTTILILFISLRALESFLLIVKNLFISLVYFLPLFIHLYYRFKQLCWVGLYGEAFGDGRLVIPALSTCTNLWESASHTLIIFIWCWSVSVMPPFDKLFHLVRVGGARRHGRFVASEHHRASVFRWTQILITDVECCWKMMLIFKFGGMFDMIELFLSCLLETFDIVTVIDFLRYWIRCQRDSFVCNLNSFTNFCIDGTDERVNLKGGVS